MVVEGFSEEALAQRVAQEQQVAALADGVREAKAAREAAEAELAGVNQQTAAIEAEFSTAKRTLEDVTAAFSRSSRDTQQADRRLSELRLAEESTRRKFTEASEAAAQFKAAEEYTGRARSQAEERLAQLREQIAMLTAEVAVSEQRAAEERAAEERAARERATAEHKAAELERVLDRVTMELATYEEQISEQHRVRDEADSKIAAAQARLDAVTPQYEAARAQRDAAMAAVTQQREIEMNRLAEHDRAVRELQAIAEEHERNLINDRLSALIEAEQAAARELADAEAKLQLLREEQDRAMQARVSLEAAVPPEPVASAEPFALPEPAAPEHAAPEPAAAPTVAGHLEADDTDLADAASASRVRPNLQLVTNGAAPASAQTPVAPLRMSSIDSRKASFSLFGWGKRHPLPADVEPAEDHISVADRIARDFGNLGNAPDAGAAP